MSNLHMEIVMDGFVAVRDYELPKDMLKIARVFKTIHGVLEKGLITSFEAKVTES